MTNNSEKLLEEVLATIREVRDELRLSYPAAMLTKAEAARRTGWSLTVISDLIARRDLAVVRHGKTGHPRIPVSELARFIHENKSTWSPRKDGRPQSETGVARKPRTRRTSTASARAGSDKVRAALRAGRKKKA